MEPSQKLTSTTIHDFPSVPTSSKASKADVSRAQLALNKIASNFLAKYENEPIDEELFMRLACTWSRLDSELCSRKQIDDEKSEHVPNYDLTSKKIKQIAKEIDIFGREVEALAHPEVKDLKNPRTPHSSEVKNLETPPESSETKTSEKARTPYSKEKEVKTQTPETPKRPFTRFPIRKPLVENTPASASFLAKAIPSVENGPIGLTNIGNSCYLNSSLQMLFSISDVRDLINRDGPKAKKNELLSTLFELMNLENRVESAPLTRKLRTILLKKGLDGLNGNGVGGQKDAHEVLNIILDELKYAPMKIGVRYQSNNDSSISKRTDEQTTYGLSIELPDTKKVTSFQDVMNGYFKDETLSMDAHITMNDEEVFDLKKAPEIVNLPSHLVISLNRFKTIGEGKNRKSQKIMTPIQFPLDKTILLPYGNEKIQYEIIGYVNHHGQTMRGGHYTANVKNCKDPVGEQRWIQCDDSSVKESAPKDQSSEPYIVLLKRKTD